MNPYVFIVGCPRSGTTLLRRMVDAHRQIAITHETHWIAKRFEKRTGLTPEGFVTPELIPKLLSDEKFTRMGIGQDELEGLVTTKLVDRLLEARGLKNLETCRELLDSFIEAGKPVLLRDLRHRYLRSLRKGAGQAPRGGQDSRLRAPHPHPARPVARGQVRSPHPRRPRCMYVGHKLEPRVQVSPPSFYLDGGSDNDGGPLVGVARAPGPGRRWIAASQTLPRGALRGAGLCARKRCVQRCATSWAYPTTTPCSNSTRAERR